MWCSILCATTGLHSFTEGVSTRTSVGGVRDAVWWFGVCICRWAWVCRLCRCISALFWCRFEFDVSRHSGVSVSEAYPHTKSGFLAGRWPIEASNYLRVPRGWSAASQWRWSYARLDIGVSAALPRSIGWWRIPRLQCRKVQLFVPDCDVERYFRRCEGCGRALRVRIRRRDLPCFQSCIGGGAFSSAFAMQMMVPLVLVST